MTRRGTQTGKRSTAVIVSTYNQPQHLDRCLAALALQAYNEFDLLVADDGSGPETAAVIAQHAETFKERLQHTWHEDDGFRKTRILNQCIRATSAEYLVFMDGDCVAHPEFVQEHVASAKPGYYLNGAVIRLTDQQTERVDRNSIESGEVFDSGWLTETAGKWNRRYLKLSLPYSLRRWLNRHSPTKLYWLGANSSCFRADAVAVNGFDNRFSYGFEDGDFGNRLVNYGLQATTVRWTANALHLDHDRHYTNQGEFQRNLAMETPIEAGGRCRAPDGLAELETGKGSE